MAGFLLISTIGVILTFVSGVISFNVCVVGSGPSGTLAAIAFKRKGHDVTVFDNDDYDYNNNFVLTERGMRALERFEIPFLEKSVVIEKTLTHFHDGREYTGSVVPSVSIRRNDLVECMRDSAERLRIPIHRSILHTIDFNRNTLYLDRGSHRYDLLVGGDGPNSRVRSSMRICYPSFDFKEKFDRREFKTLEMSTSEIHRIDGYDEMWKRSLHVWNGQGGSHHLICTPTLGGGMTASYISSEGFEMSKFPRVFNAMEWFKFRNFDLRNTRSQKSVYCSHVGLGDVILVGDAGHTMWGCQGQGINAALEDSVHLDRCIDLRSDATDVVKTYNNIRIDDAHAACKLSEFSELEDRFYFNFMNNSHGVTNYIGKSDISYGEILKIMKVR